MNTNDAELQVILDNTTAVIFVKDSEGRYRLINRQFEKLFGVTKEEVRGVGWRHDWRREHGRFGFQLLD